MKTITIPKRFGYPTLDIIINGKVYNVKSGEEITVEDSVAEAIENAVALAPKLGVSRNKFAQFASRTITEVTLDDLAGADEIPRYFFEGCSNLKRVDIPSSVKSLGYYSFVNCTSLERVRLYSTTPPTIQAGIFNGCPATCRYVVPKEAVEAYKTAEFWDTIASRIIAAEE